MADEKFTVAKGGHSNLPSNKIPGRILVETDTGDMYLDVSTSERKKLSNNPSQVNGHSVQSDVPSNAKFTDTTYSSLAAKSGGSDVSLVTTGEKYTWNSKTSNTGTLTGIKMNGVSKGTSGVVDLGTVLTGGSQTTTSTADGGSNVYTFSDNSTITVKNGTKGSKGDIGPQGPQGEKGDTGTAATISVGTVTTGAAGTNAAVTNAGTSSAAKLNFTIPRGANGTNGTSAAWFTGTAVTGTSTTAVTVSVTGSKAGDMYLNTSTYNVYSATAANSWVYKCNIKGATGSTGSSGAAAGFGTPTATVDANTGTPSVTVTATGTNTAKVFNFAFKNLKGKDGTNGTNGVTPTIKAAAGANIGAVGTPSVTAATSGTTTTFTFNNLKGAKGEPGTNATTTAVATTTANGLMSSTDKKNLDVLKTPLATCATARNIAAKVATLANFTLTVGSTIAVKFTDTGTANPASGNLTLNVNNTGAKNIGYSNNGSKAIFTYPSASFFCNNVTRIFTYDGTYWLCMDYDRDTHYTTHMYTGENQATAHSTTAVSNPYINILDNATYRNGTQLKAGTNMSISAINGVVTFNSTYSDTKMNITNTNPTTAAWYYPIWTSTTSGATTGNVNNGLMYNTVEGTDSTVGHSYLRLGNPTASGTADNKRGHLRIYAESTGYDEIVSAATAARTITLPDASGTVSLNGHTHNYLSLTGGTIVTSESVPSVRIQSSSSGTGYPYGYIDLYATGSIAGNIFGKLDSENGGKRGIVIRPYDSGEGAIGDGSHYFGDAYINNFDKVVMSKRSGDVYHRAERTDLTFKDSNGDSQHEDIRFGISNAGNRGIWDRRSSSWLIFFVTGTNTPITKGAFSTQEGQITGNAGEVTKNVPFTAGRNYMYIYTPRIPRLFEKIQLVNNASGTLITSGYFTFSYTIVNTTTEKYVKLKVKYTGTGTPSDPYWKYIVFFCTL